MLHVSNFKFEHVYLYVYYSCNTNKCEHYFTGTYKERLVLLLLQISVAILICAHVQKRIAWRVLAIMNDHVIPTITAAHYLVPRTRPV